MLKSLQIVGNARYGGATYLTLEWCKYLQEQDCQVDILCTEKQIVSEAKAISGVNVIDHIYIPHEIRPATDLKAFKQMVKLLRQERYNVVHTYTATPSYLGRCAARLAGVSVIVNHQGGWAVNEGSSFVQRAIFTPLEYLGTLACTKNICVSHAEAEKASQLHLAPKEKLITIVNGINPEPFIGETVTKDGALLRKTLGIPADHLVIGNTDRLVSGKGNDTLIQAMSLLRQCRPDQPFTLLLAGDGTDYTQLEALIESGGLNGQVKLLGFVREIPTYLAAIDLFILPTFTAGLSTSLLEAMASAKAIIATDIPANAELIDHGATGLLVPAKSPDRIAQAISQYIDDPSLAHRCATAAQERVLDYYTLDRMFDETWDLYRKLLTGLGSSDYLQSGAQDSARQYGI